MTERLSLFLPTFACDVVRLRLHLDPRQAILLTRAERQREVIARCCAVAAAAGIHPGMTLAHARAILPAGRGVLSAHIAPDDEPATARSLRRLAARMVGFVPRVAIEDSDGLGLDATGCARLYGGTDRLMGLIAAWMCRHGLNARLICAPTWGAAWALARFGFDPHCIIPPEQLRAALLPLPVAALGIDPETEDRLHQVGIERIEHLTPLLRSALAERCGSDLLLRLDRALGAAVEVVSPLRFHTPILAERLFDGPTDRLEDIQHAARGLLGAICGLLAQRERGCRRLDVILFRSDLPPLTLTLRASRPTRDPDHLWRLLRPRTEKAHLGFGVEGLRAHVVSVAALPHEQAAAWADEQVAVAPPEIGKLVDTLAARFGPEHIVRFKPVESHFPERASAYKAVGMIDALRPLSDPTLADADRPSALLARPIPIEVVLLRPDGPLACLRIGGAARVVRACIGPERIEPEWWRGPGPARDYFKAQTEEGRWWWVFREAPAGRWFIHGEWA